MKRFAMFALAILALACLGPPAIAHDGYDLIPALAVVEKVMTVDTVLTVNTVSAAQCGCHVAVSVTNRAPEVNALYARAISPEARSVSANIVMASAPNMAPNLGPGANTYPQGSRLPDPLRLRMAWIRGRNHASC